MNNSQAIINFMYFGHNYPSNFILEVWKGILGKHFQDKFSSMYHRHVTNTFFVWYMELSNDNKEILNAWIETNYSYKK